MHQQRHKIKTLDRNSKDLSQFLPVPDGGGPGGVAPAPAAAAALAALHADSARADEDVVAGREGAAARAALVVDGGAHTVEPLDVGRLPGNSKEKFLA